MTSARQDRTSLRHDLALRFLAATRSNYSPEDVPAMRANLVRDNRAVREIPPGDVLRRHRVTMRSDRGFPVTTLTRGPGGSAGGSAGGSERAPARTLLYLHGGGFVKPSHAVHWRFATRLAEELDARTVLPAYPLAPEFTVHDSLPAMVDLLAELAEDSPDGVVLAGDSAGGGYALALAQALRDAGGPRPERLVLLAPWVDLTGEAPGTREAAARDPWLSYPHLSLYAAFWAGSEDSAALKHPWVSPALGDLRDLPPTLMVSGTRDLLQPGCDALAARALEQGWALEYDLEPGLMHVYPLLPVPEGRRAFDRIVDFCLPDLG